jgi:hypothetical protein
LSQLGGRHVTGTDEDDLPSGEVEKHW